jgi:transposase-like protein
MVHKWIRSRLQSPDERTPENEVLREVQRKQQELNERLAAVDAALAYARHGRTHV